MFAGLRVTIPGPVPAGLSVSPCMNLQLQIHHLGCAKNFRKTLRKIRQPAYLEKININIDCTESASLKITSLKTEKKT